MNNEEFIIIRHLAKLNKHIRFPCQKLTQHCFTFLPYNIVAYNYNFLKSNINCTISETVSMLFQHHAKGYTYGICLFHNERMGNVFSENVLQETIKHILSNLPSHIIQLFTYCM